MFQIREEIEARRRTYSTVTMDVRSCSPNVGVGADLLKINTIEPWWHDAARVRVTDAAVWWCSLYATAHSTKSFNDTGDGMWYFEVTYTHIESGFYNTRSFTG